MLLCQRGKFVWQFRISFHPCEVSCVSPHAAQDSIIYSDSMTVWEASDVPKVHYYGLYNVVAAMSQPDIIAAISLSELMLYQNLFALEMQMKEHLCLDITLSRSKNM